MHNDLVRDESSTGKAWQKGVWRHLCGIIMALLVVMASYSAAGAQTQPRAYVANQCTNTVSVIDIATNIVSATIPVGVGASGVAITPDGARAYVTNQLSNTVSVIDTATKTFIATIVGVACPAGIAITPPQARVPLSGEECKNGGWRTFGAPAGPFSNQEECVSYVKNKSKNRQ